MFYGPTVSYFVAGCQGTACWLGLNSVTYLFRLSTPWTGITRSTVWEPPCSRVAISCMKDRYQPIVMENLPPWEQISHYFVKYMHSSNLEYVTSMKEDNYNCKGCPI